jgi:drug/metabolite transporter (DMT)-like permease
MRFAVAGLILAPIVFRNGFGGLSILKASVLAMGAGAPYVLVTVTGLSMAPAGHGGVIIPCAMLSASTLGAWVVLKDAPTVTRLAGLALIFAGIGVTAWSGLDLRSATWSLPSLIGDGLFIMGGMLWALYTVAPRAWGAAPLQATAAVSVLSMLIVVPVWLMTAGDAVWQAPLAALAWQAGFQGVLVAIGALVLYTKAISVFGAARGALFAILGPVFTVLLAMPILKEMPSSLAVLGLVLCTVGMGVAFGLLETTAGLMRKAFKPGTAPPCQSAST